MLDLLNWSSFIIKTFITSILPSELPYKYWAKVDSKSYFPEASPILFKVAVIYFLFCSLLSERPSANAQMKFLAFALSYRSFKIPKTRPVRLMKTLINCLFGSLILTLKVLNRSWTELPRLIFYPYSFIKLISV